MRLCKHGKSPALLKRINRVTSFFLQEPRPQDLSLGATKSDQQSVLLWCYGGTVHVPKQRNGNLTAYLRVLFLEPKLLYHYYGNKFLLCFHLAAAVWIIYVAWYAIQTNYLKLWLEQFSNDCRNSNNKLLIPTNHNRSKQHGKPIRISTSYP